LADVAVVARVSSVAVPEVAPRAAARLARRALLIVAAAGWHAARCAGHAAAWHAREQYATPRHAPHRSRAPRAPQRSHAPTPVSPTAGDVVGFKPTSARCTSSRLASQGGAGGSSRGASANYARRVSIRAGVIASWPSRAALCFFEG
jgi:hypothetical protein